MSGGLVRRLLDGAAFAWWGGYKMTMSHAQFAGRWVSLLLIPRPIATSMGF
ncbi:MAG: hypothetical protein M3R43_03675 [Acidobacteriota bacterium]|nr:hypothetical protein [Acidobacteriota bacterium]